MDFSFALTKDFQKIQCLSAPSEKEHKKLKKYFKRMKKDSFMNPAVRHGFVDGSVSFFDGVYLPVGLWGELQRYMDEHSFTYEILGLDVFINNSLTNEEVAEFVNKLFEGTVINDIRWYQYESIYKILKFRYSAQQISTAAGKTMISYAVASYLINSGEVNEKNKFLLIVPRAGLVGQTKEKFELYNNGTVTMNILPIGDKFKYDKEKFDTANVVISTYQSLSNLPDEIFKNISAINVDEAHTARTTSIKRVIKLASPLMYRFGLSGTLMVRMSSAEYYDNLSQLGPITMIYNPKDLINDGFAPSVKITQVTIDYTGQEDLNKYSDYFEFKKAGDYYKDPLRKNSDDALKYYKDFYKMERNIICSDEERLDTIINYLSKIDRNKNILVLFNDIKGDYGKNIYEKMNKFKTTKYIDGSTKSLERSLYTEEIEEKNINLVASFGTFSTGIDLKNVHYIVFAESYKSPVLIGQSIGRGLRNHKSKKTINIIDFVDSMYKHTINQSAERVAIYNKEKYEIKKETIKLLTKDI